MHCRFWGNGWGQGLTAKEKGVLAPLNKIFADFVAIKDVQWPEKGPRSVLTLRASGKLEMTRDERYKEGVSVWQTLTGSKDARVARL